MERLFFGSSLILALAVLAGCANPAGANDGDFPPIGTREAVTVGSESLTMIFANDSSDITFPTEWDDSGSATLTTRFWIAESEITNSVIAEVLQWAYGDNRFSSTVGDPNGLDTTTAKHGGQALLNLSSPFCRVDYDGSGNFSVESAYENHPVTNITWYGAVMICNWLTEMRDGNAANAVYTGIDTDWQDEETVENVAKSGYRLPSVDEWQYAARYRGTDSANTASGFSNPYFTKGDSASGATADYADAAATQAVAVYPGQSPAPSDHAAVKSLGAGSADALGLYDMSGNVYEWCSDVHNTTDRIYAGGSWESVASRLRIGTWYSMTPDNSFEDTGFRLCRTAD